MSQFMMRNDKFSADILRTEASLQLRDWDVLELEIIQATLCLDARLLSNVSNYSVHWRSLMSVVDLEITKL